MVALSASANPSLTPSVPPSSDSASPPAIDPPPVQLALDLALLLNTSFAVLAAAAAVASCSTEMEQPLGKLVEDTVSVATLVLPRPGSSVAAAKHASAVSTLWPQVCPARVKSAGE